MKFSLSIILITSFFLGCQTKGKLSTSTTKSSSSVSKKSQPVTLTTKKNSKALSANPALAQKSIYEELTGKKRLPSKYVPAQILELARDAKWKRDYITALKRYNTLIVKYPKSKEVRAAYLDKAALYKEMGLVEQSKYNAKKAKK